MNRIAIYGNRHQDEYLDELQCFFQKLDSRGCEVWIKDHFFTYLKSRNLQFSDNVRIITDIPEEVECVISIGGDGTFLRAAEWVGNRGVPILGINTGHLGFLASYSLGEVDELVDVIINDLGKRESRILLTVKCDAMPEGFLPYALNEVVVQRGENASMVCVHAEIDGHFLADYLADGLVVSTPTGSTAYNLSIGGPILQPTLQCFVISPIAPHSLTMRPLVVSSESSLKFRPESRGKTIRVSLDGRDFAVDSGAHDVIVTKAPYSITVLRRPSSNFSELLRNKLFWGK